MKKTVFYLVMGMVLCFFVSCNQKGSDKIPASVVTNTNSAEGSTDAGKLPKIVFEKDFHDFGKLIAGEKVSYSFKFKNTGKSLLVISAVNTSCGCTVSNYPKQPIKPGETNYIDVSFDSKGTHGFQHKTVTVTSNTQPMNTTLRIQANVENTLDM